MHLSNTTRTALRIVRACRQSRPGEGCDPRTRIDRDEVKRLYEELSKRRPFEEAMEIAQTAVVTNILEGH